MQRSRRILHAAVAVVLVLVASGCDSADRLSAPVETTPQFNQGNGQNAPGLTRKTIRRLTTAWLQGEYAARFFDRRGGEIGVRATDGTRSYSHVLLVGRNTVQDWTLFEMKVADGAFLGVDLHATTVGQRRYNDAGEAGFKHPPTLCMDVSAADLTDRTRTLSLAWDRGDGDLVPVPSSRYTDRQSGADYLCGLVDHFSRFVVIHN